MKRLSKYFCVAILMVFALPTFAQRNGLVNTKSAINRLGFQLSGGYSAMPLLCEGIDMGEGYVASAGLVYERQNGTFLFDCGVDFMWQQTTNYVANMMKWDAEQIDAWNTPYTLHTSLIRHDITRIGYVNIPLLFGQNIGHFYYLVGPEIGVKVIQDLTMQSNITTTAEYNLFDIPPIHETDNHGYRTDVPVQQKSDLVRFNVDVRLHAELGISVGHKMRRMAAGGAMKPRQNVRYRFAAFADYGIIQYNTATSNEAVVTMGDNPYAFKQATMYPIVCSTYKSGNIATNLMAGVKFTILFGFQPTYKCVICDDTKKPMF